MNLMLNPQLNGRDTIYNSSSVVLTASNEVRETVSYSTIDGDVINFNDGSDAINAGSGIFIGGYFVGNSTYTQASDTPYLKY